LIKKEHSYEYGKHLLEFKLGELQRFSIGTNTKYLTMEIFKRLKVQVPPVELQEKFREVAARHNQSQKQLSVLLEESNALFASLSQRAFRGEL
jgi:type I restriction enzyme S subunit